MRAHRRFALTSTLVLTALLGASLQPQTAVAATGGAVPSTPRNVAAKVADGALRLSWTPPKGTAAASIASYSARFRTVGASGWSAARSVATSPMRFPSLANGTRYELQVRAETASASGAWSAAVTAAPGRAPGAVAGVRVLRFGASGTAVSWSRPADTGGRTIVRYDVRLRSSASAAWHRTKRETTTAITLAATDASAQVQVRAVSSLGAGSWSAVASPVPTGTAAVPTHLRATSARGSVTLRWSAVSRGTSTAVRWRRTGSDQWSTRVVTGTSTTLTGLPTASSRFSVAAVTGGVIGRFSVPVSAAPGRIPATAPRSPKAVAGDTAVSITWSRPASGHPNVYEVAYRAAGSTTWRTVRTKHRSLVVRGLRDGLAYRFTVRGLRPTAGARSMSVGATPTVRAKAPTALALRLDPTTSALAATWTAPAAGPTARSYDVRYRAASSTTWTTVAAAGAIATTTTLAGLPGGARYSVQVRARTEGGGGAWSATAAAYLPVFSLPVMDVETTGGAPIVDKDTYLPSAVSVADGTSPANAYSGTAQVKGHGNSTWPLPKKPYRLKLDTKASLLGMPASKHWILLANYKDRTLLRNDVALYLGKQTGLAWTPDSRFVELVVNGRYQGLYELAEQVRVDPTRVNIDALSSKDARPTKITGGYLLERDGNRQPDDVGFDTPTGEPITVGDPETPTAAQLAYISGYVDDFENALYSDHSADPGTGYAKYIDVDSFVDWYIVEELVENSDAWFSSAYMVKPRGGKLAMGPLWDFDLSTMDAGVTKGKATSWYVKDLGWWARLTRDPAFAQQVTERWQVLKPRFDTVFARIAAQRTAMATAAAQDEQVWGYTTHDANVTAMTTFLRTREAWLDTQWR